VRVSLKSVQGVDNVSVSLEKGLASVTLKPGNTATLKQLGDAIAKNGFTMKQSEATIAGQVVQDAGKMKLQITGSNERLELVPDSASASPTANFAGKTVEVAGTIPEAPKGKTPDAIRYRTIVEKK
jgi:copper chaperone CopZ